MYCQGEVDHGLRNAGRTDQRPEQLYEVQEHNGIRAREENNVSTRYPQVSEIYCQQNAPHESQNVHMPQNWTQQSLHQRPQYPYQQFQQYVQQVRPQAQMQIPIQMQLQSAQPHYQPYQSQHISQLQNQPNLNSYHIQPNARNSMSNINEHIIENPREVQNYQAHHMNNAEPRAENQIGGAHRPRFFTLDANMECFAKEQLSPHFALANINNQIQFSYYPTIHYQQNQHRQNPPLAVPYYQDQVPEQPDKSYIHTAPVYKAIPAPINGQFNTREWFEQALILAREAYKTKNYTDAYQILHSLHEANPRDIPTLLLLGCTCYSLSMHHLSIYYNNMILQIDPNIVEALSNLGTTHKALAQMAQMFHANGQGEGYDRSFAHHLSIAEQCYRTVISKRPMYWDANINLAVLLAGSGRNNEAMLVYSKLESAFDEYFSYEEKYDALYESVQNSSTRSGSLGCIKDRSNIDLIISIERRRCERNARERAMSLPETGISCGFTPERRRNLYYAKGCLYYTIGNLEMTKIEYYKYLVSIDIDIARICESYWSGLFPQPFLTPQQSLISLQSHQQNRQYYEHKANGNILNLATSTSVPAVKLPTISGNPLPEKFYNTIASSVFQTLGKICQDSNKLSMAVVFYYHSLSIYPTANACNNIGIILSQRRLDESIAWYNFGLLLDSNHVQLLTNMGSALRDRGQVNEGVTFYQKAISICPDFYVALANLANFYKDIGKVEEAINLYKGSAKYISESTESFCNYVNILFFVCSWEKRTEHLMKIKGIVQVQLKEGGKQIPKVLPTILPFHTFTYTGLDSWMVREISRCNAHRVTWDLAVRSWFPGFPERPAIAMKKLFCEISKSFPGTEYIPAPILLVANIIRNIFLDKDPCLVIDSINTREVLKRFISEVGASDQLLAQEISFIAKYPYPYSLPPRGKINLGYVSSDFNDHPLAHLMQSVFLLHDRSRFRVICYALSPKDLSTYRQRIQEGADLFICVSQWSVDDIIKRITTVDNIHILCNLNGYTKGARNEIFAARPAPVQIQYMGYAGTLGAGEVFDPENNNFGSDWEKNGREESLNTCGCGRCDSLSLKDNLWNRISRFEEANKEELYNIDEVQGKWLDYLVADEIVCPRKLICNEPIEDEIELNPKGQPKIIDRQLVRARDDKNRMYTEALIYLPHSYFINDYYTSFREEKSYEVESLLLGDDLDGSREPLPLEPVNDILSLGSDFLDEEGADYGTELYDGNSSFNFDQSEVEDERLTASLTEDERLEWSREQLRRVIARARLFPRLKRDVVIYANFNQLYKIDPDVFHCWVRTLKRVPNSILWLLRFPGAGEARLERYAASIAGEEITKRIIFTDIASKYMHLYRGRVPDIFLDTPECNAHTTTTDTLWSGSPIVTYPKYDFKMCSRVCCSILYAAGSWKEEDYDLVDGKADFMESARAGISMPGVKSLNERNLLAHWLVTKSYQEYEEVAVNLGRSMKWKWVKIQKLRENNIRPREPKYFHPTFNPTHVYTQSTSCLAGRLRMRLFLSRETSNLFNTKNIVRYLEDSYVQAYEKWEREYDLMRKRNEMEILLSAQSWADAARVWTHPRNCTNEKRMIPLNYTSATIRVYPYTPDISYRRKKTRCIWAKSDPETNGGDENNP